MSRVPERYSHSCTAVRAMRTAADGAGGVRIGWWLSVLGCWVAVPGGLLPQARSSPSGAARQSQACGPVVEAALKCPRFEFRHTMTSGWVDWTADIRKDGVREGTSSEASAKPEERIS